MYLKAFRVTNFRRLKRVCIDIADDISIFVGSNNSGKTSASHVIQMFIDGTLIDHDFPALSALHTACLNPLAQVDLGATISPFRVAAVGKT